MDLEPKHNAAIRAEIGERLRLLLSRDQERMPSRLHGLIRRLGEGERSPVGDAAPSGAPDARPELAASSRSRPMMAWLQMWRAFGRRPR